MSNADQFREMAEAYAMGALDANERAAFEEHLAAGCVDCGRALAEARYTVSQLAYLAPEAEPSAAVRERILQAARTEAKVTPLRSSKKGGIPFWMWAGVAALLAFTAYSAWDARQMQREVRDLEARSEAELKNREELLRQRDELHREAMILSDPESVRIAMPCPDHSMPALEAKWHWKMGIVVMGQKIPTLPENRVLQLWLIPKAAGGKPIPSMAMRPEANGKLVLVVSNPPQDLAGTKALAVTEEPAGGSAAPTSAPMWVGGIS